MYCYCTISQSFHITITCINFKNQVSVFFSPLEVIKQNFHSAPRTIPPPPLPPAPPLPPPRNCSPPPLPRPALTRARDTLRSW